MKIAGLDKKTITRFAMGAIEERIDYAMTMIADNMFDVNTKATAKRKLVITLEFMPNEDRSKIRYDAKAEPKLAPTTPISTMLCAVGDGNGELVLMEMTPQIPGQTDMYGGEQEEPAVVKLVRQV